MTLMWEVGDDHQNWRWEVGDGQKKWEVDFFDVGGGR